MLIHKYENTKLILVDDLSPEDTAMLQAHYSRSAAGAEVDIQKIYDARRQAIKKELLDEHMSVSEDDLCEAMRVIAAGDGGSNRAGDFMRKFYVGYNHSSIADCGSTTLFMEGVSLLAAKAIQDWPLYSGQETSTRYIDMGKQNIEDPVDSDLSGTILTAWMDFYLQSQEAVAEVIRARYPKGNDEKQSDYDGAVKARTFDILRGFLPAGIHTNVSWHTNLRQANDHLRLMEWHPAQEVQALREGLYEGLLQPRYPDSFGANAAVSGVGQGSLDDKLLRRRWTSSVAAAYSYHQPFSNSRPYLSFDPTININRLAAYLPMLKDRPRGCVIPHFLTDLGQITWRFELDFGSFRDIQRQRNGVCRMPLLDTSFGFEPWYIDQLPLHLRTEAMALIYEQTQRIKEVSTSPVDRQYYTALGFKVPCSVTYALPAAVYVLELRAGKMIHPTLRTVVHGMVKDFQRTFPEVPLHVDMDPDAWSVRRGTQTITERV